MDTEKEIQTLKIEIDNLKRKKINDIVNNLPAVTAGTINTGDATTDLILLSVFARLEKLISNISNQ